jgi:hypothetical protein
MKNGFAAPLMTALLLISTPSTGFAADGTTGSDKSIGSSPGLHSVTNADGAQAASVQKSQPAAQPTKLSCKAARIDLGKYESLRIISITVDPAKKYVKMVHEGDGRTFEFTDGLPSAQGNKNFVKVTDELIVYGQGQETSRSRLNVSCGHRSVNSSAASRNGRKACRPCETGSEPRLYSAVFRLRNGSCQERNEIVNSVVSCLVYG